MKRLGVFLLPVDGMLVNRSVTPSIFTGPWEYSVLPKNTTQCPRPGPKHDPEPLEPESSTLNHEASALTDAPSLHQLKREFSLTSKENALLRRRGSETQKWVQLYQKNVTIVMTTVKKLAWKLTFRVLAQLFQKNL